MACHTARRSPPGPRETGNGGMVDLRGRRDQHPIVTIRLLFGIDGAHRSVMIRA
jgi:hypothetical protein